MTNKVTKFVDTNVFVRNPDEVNGMQDGGKSTLLIPWKVQEELDTLKGKPDIGMDARQAIRLIEENQISRNPNLLFCSKTDWRDTCFDNKDKGDHVILATINHAIKNMSVCNNAPEIHIVSADANFRIQAREIFKNKKIKVLPYDKDETDVLRYSSPPEICFNGRSKKKNGLYLYDPDQHGLIIENQGVILRKYIKRKETIVPALMINGRFEEIKTDIQVLGIKPRNLNGEGFNWGQFHALDQLLRQEIKLCFLLGGAGTGKTFLALAAALQQKKNFNRIIVSRPMVPMGGEDKMGFLPGDMKSKMDPWLLPIWQNLDTIKEVSETNKTMIENCHISKKIDVQPLDFIRGTSFRKTLLIIDEAQNLTAHQIKTIITRVGEDSKIIFTGDLTQIDDTKKINSRSSGLNYAAARMQDNELVGVTIFKESVRSPLTKLANERLC